MDRPMTLDEYKRTFPDSSITSDYAWQVKYNAYMYYHGPQDPITIAPTPKPISSTERERRLHEGQIIADKLASDEKRRLVELKDRQWGEHLGKMYRMYYEDWYPREKEEFITRWKSVYSILSRKQKYDLLMHNMFGLAGGFGVLFSAGMGQGVAEPWKSINASIGKPPPNPDTDDVNEVNLFYDYTLPEAGTIATWYNTPGVDLGTWTQQMSLAYRFKWSPRAEVQANYTLLRKDVEDVGKKVEPAFYVAAAVIGVVGVAYITSKVSK